LITAGKCFYLLITACTFCAAFIPAPILYGQMIDATCLIWSHTCSAGTGSCALYDVTRLRHNYIGLETGGKALSLCFFALTLLILTWQVRTGRTKDEPPNKSKTIRVETVELEVASPADKDKVTLAESLNGHVDDSAEKPASHSRSTEDAAQFQFQ
jgi:hypothetical protein